MTETIENIDDVLSGNDAGETETAEAETQKVETKAETETPEEAKGEDSKESAETPAAEEESWTKKAVLDERRKRQAAEAELAEYRKEKQSGEKSEKSDTPIAELLLKERINLSREMMLDKHEDYEEMETVFVDMVKSNPALADKMNASPNPAKFAYSTAKNFKEAESLSDPKKVEEMKAKIREEVLAELKGETPEAKRKKSATQVPDLTNATSASSGHATPENETLNDIFGGR